MCYERGAQWMRQESLADAMISMSNSAVGRRRRADEGSKELPCSCEDLGVRMIVMSVRI